MIARLKGLDLLSSTRFNSSRAGRRDARIRAFKYPLDLGFSAVVLSSGSWPGQVFLLSLRLRIHPLPTSLRHGTRSDEKYNCLGPER